jgi:hypothetical protein
MKKQKILLILFKMILFVLFGFFFIRQLKNVHWSSTSFSLVNPLYLFISLFLVPFNWLPEYQKWKLALGFQKLVPEKKIVVQSFFAGIVSGMLTPNMLGNFIGRMYYFNRKHRGPLIFLTLISNYAQFVSSMLFGIIALLVLRASPLGWKLQYVWLSIAFLCCILLFYILLDYLMRWMYAPKRFMHSFSLRLKENQAFQWKTLLFSLMRHGVFTTQFASMLYAVGEDISLHSIFWIWQTYFWLTLSPGFILGKLIVRESVSAWVLGYAGMDVGLVMGASFFLWGINLLVPTLFGVVICKTK